MALLSLSFFFFFLLFFTIPANSSAGAGTVDHMERGFSATPNPSSNLQFQSLLADTTSTFAFGFLRIGSSNLDLAMVHLPSSVPLWRAQASQPVSWSSSTSLLFNGSLILLQHGNSLSWSSTNVADDGDQLILLNTSNLQISKDDSSVLWQSFDFPSDSILQNQNFTSNSVLVSANQQYSMKLGRNFLGLYVGKNSGGPMYWKHTAMEAKAQIIDGRGPIYARLDPTGFLGLYQTEKALVDVLSFDSFNAGTPKKLWRLTLESDGNLRAYYYNGSSGWISDFKAISDTCSLPAACGAYGLCHLDGPAQCGCLDNGTETTGGCLPADSADLCGGASGFRVLRSAGVELANEEYIAFQKIGSLEACESSCERDCSCWGAVYSNTSGNCYRMDYPILTVLAVSDERKVGYFKVRDGGGGGGEKRKRAKVVLVVIGTMVLVCGCGFTVYRIWNGKKKSRIAGEANGVLGERLPYKGLSSMSSFQNLELSFMKKG